jgi:hypothetical protein
MRQALDRAIALRTELAPLDWRVLCEVINLTASYSRLTDKTHATVIAKKVGASERWTRHSLEKLRDKLGIIVWKPKRGRHSFSTVGLPPAVNRTPRTSGFPEARKCRKPEVRRAPTEKNPKSGIEENTNGGATATVPDNSKLGAGPSREDGDKTTDRLLAAARKVGSEAEAPTLVERARQAQLAGLPEPDSRGFVAAVCRRFPPGDPERRRLFALHHESALGGGPTLDDVLDAEVEQLVAEGVLVEEARRAV